MESAAIFVLRARAAKKSGSHDGLKADIERDARRAIVDLRVGDQT